MTIAPRILLVLAGLLDAAVGVAFVALPYQWTWHKGVEGAPRMIVWAWYSSNALLGFLLVFAGIATLALAASRRAASASGVVTLLALAVVWGLTLAYQYGCQPPLPEAMERLRDPLRLLSLGMCLLHATPAALALAGRAAKLDAAERA